MKKILVVVGMFFFIFSFLSYDGGKKQEKKSVLISDNTYLETPFLSSDAYLIKNGLIRGVPTNTTKEQLFSNLRPISGELKVICDNNLNIVGTGCLVQNFSGNEEIDRNHVVVTGDVNGDGEHTVTDIVKVLKHVEKKSELKDAFLDAADVDYDKSVSKVDAKILAQYTLDEKDFPVPGNDYEEDDGRYVTITLSTNSISLDKGSTMKIDATLSSDVVTIINWKSADESVAVVDSNGVVTAVDGGSTTITVTASNGKTASVKVNVKVKIPTTGVTLNLSTSELSLGEEQQLVATVSPGDADDKTISWASENNNIATVDKNGKITAKSVGTTTITATTVDGFTAKCMIKVNNVLNIDILSSDDSVILAGDTVTYTIKSFDTSVISSIDSSKIHFYTQSPIDYQLVEYEDFSVHTENGTHKIVLKVPDDVSELGLMRLEIDSGAVKDSFGNISEKYINDDYVVSLNLNATAQTESTTYGSGDAAISIAVGVDNSFYVKSYDYYINNTLVKVSSTTNSLLYSKNLKNDTTYEVLVQVSLYRDRLIYESGSYYSSLTGDVASIETLSDDIVIGTVSSKIKIPTALNQKKLMVDFIDVSESVGDYGDAIFVYSNGKTVLIDTGTKGLDENSDTYTDPQRIVEIIKEKTSSATCKLDYLMFSHSDLDHTGGASEILNSCKVNNIVVSVNHYNGYEGIYSRGVGKTVMYPIDYALDHDVNLILLTAGNVLDIGGVIFNVLNPYNSIEVPNRFLRAKKDGGLRKDVYYCDGYLKAGTTNKTSCSTLYSLTTENNNSIVFHLMLGREKMLLTGDAQFYAEEFMLGLVSGTTGIKTSDEYELTAASGTKYYLDHPQYLSLLTDIMNAENISKEQTISKYKLDRFTEKDVSSAILKRGHHAYVDSTSIDFLNKVGPNIIVASAYKYENKNLYGMIPYLRNTAEDRILTYYRDTLGITLTESNWKNYVLSPNFNTTSDFKRGVIEFYTYGREWTRNS